MPTPLISIIIIPVYNVEEYLRECLDSVVNQTLKDIEIICVNDGSTDSSPAILEEYALKDARITVVHQDNQGLSEARNVGLQIAKTKYISFVDSDDFLDLQMYETVYPQLGKADLVAFAAQSFLHCDNKDRRIYCIGDYEAPFVGKGTMTEDMRRVLNVTVWTKVFSKEILDTYKLKFPKGLLYEDTAFTFNYNAVSKTIYYFEEHCYNYRIREDSIMGKTCSKQICAFDVLHLCKDIYDFLVKHDLFEKNEQLFAARLRNSLYTTLSYSHKSEKEKIFTIYEKYVTSFLGNTAMSPVYLNQVRQDKRRNIFSPQKYYTYKILSFITFGATRERFCRKCQFQKSLRD